MMDGAGLVADGRASSRVRRGVLARLHGLHLLLHHRDDLIQRHRAVLRHDQRARGLVQAPRSALEFLARFVNGAEAVLELLDQQVRLRRLVLRLVKAREREAHVVLAANAVQDSVRNRN